MNKEQIEKMFDESNEENDLYEVENIYTWNSDVYIRKLDVKKVKKVIFETIIPNILKIDWDIKNILENLKNRDSKDYEFAWKNQEIYDKWQIDAYALVLEKIKQKAKEDFWIEI